MAYKRITKGKIDPVSRLILMMVLMLVSIGHSQNNLLTATLDGSRLIEDQSEFDSGLDLSITLVMLRQSKIRPLVKFEAFPSLQYYKSSIGAEYAIPIGDILELSIGAELGMISRSTDDYEAYFGFVTYGFNGDIRIFRPFRKFPVVFSWNEQWRSDFDIYRTDPKFVGSLFIGIGYPF